MLTILREPEKILKSRFNRRGFSLEECKNILQSKKGDVTFLKQRSLFKSNIKDLGNFVNC